MTIARFLDLSTKYITFSDGMLLMNRSDPAAPSDLIVFVQGHGWFVNVEMDPVVAGELASILIDQGFSEAFVAVLRYAREHDCRWINFDTDGEHEEGLPTFDW